MYRYLSQSVVTVALLLGLPVAALAQAPVAVPTFESVGVTWPGTPPLDPNGGAQLQFRKAGDTAWAEGLPLWFDSRENEYRGSLVNLAPGTRYEVKVTRDDTFTQTVTAQTWPQQFPIARTVTLPTSSNAPLTITESGSPSGYILYTAAPGATATIDVAKLQDFDVRIQASYVIVRGLTLKGANRHAIVIGDGLGNPAGVTHVVIENNDVSAWGSVSGINRKFGRDDDSAIYSNASDLAHVVIQRNKLHHPSFDANSREETHGDSKTPRGPVAINLTNSAGNLVVRYNEIYSDATHYFRDGITGGPQYSNTGFPNRDSDIYGNTVTNVWGDAIDAVGANRNVRVWGNYLDQVFAPIGMAPSYGGPLYVWRNISHTISSGPANRVTASFLKIRNIDVATGVDWGGGRSYIFNNAALTPRVGSGVASFVSPFSSSDLEIRNLRTLNNVMMVRGPTYFSIRAASARDVAFNYDLFNGRTTTPTGQELNGVKGVAQLVADWGFDPASSTGKFALDTASPGYDGGVAIPNFVTDFTGRAPDIGAHEALTPPLEFGTAAYLPSPSAGTLQFGAAAYSVNEAGVASITITRTDGSFGKVSVRFDTTTGGTATGGSDFVDVSARVRWEDGDASSKTINIPIIDDTIDEPGRETVKLILLNPAGATLGDPATAELTILDNDDPMPAPTGTVQFNSAGYTIGESGRTANIAISRTGGSSGAARVRFRTTAMGTATADSDFTGVVIFVNWVDGEATTKMVSVPILDDSIDEDDTETVVMVLSNAVGASLGALVSATLSILDDDAPSTGPPLKVMLVGDSTVTDQRGWGLGFKVRAADNITVINRAVSGTSSRSYRDLGYWDQALLQGADYVLIQFGHNDQPGKPPEKVTDPETTYKDNMTRYVAEARAAGIKPILVTSLTRRYYDSRGKIRLNVPLTPYAAVVRALAPSLNVPLVDLHTSSIAFFNVLGPNGWQQYAPPGDETHLNQAGSYEVSRLVVQDLPPELKPYFHTR